MNKCVLVGNLTHDPELAQTSSGISVCKFSIAVNRRYEDANGERQADFINIVAWRGLAENCAKYLTKGKKAAICGQIQTRSYDKDGEKRYVTEVIAEDVEFIGGNGNNAAEPQEPPKRAKKTVSELQPIEDDGLPF